jgi:cysteine desulfurase
MKKIYLDNAATTKVDKKVFRAMESFFLSNYGNASEYHKQGLLAKKALEKARERVAFLLRAKRKEIYFTGSATESINLAIKGLVERNKKKKGPLAEVIISSVEHKAVLETCKHLENLGWIKIRQIPVDKEGRINLQVLEKLVTKDTLLVSVMYVNNEVGTIQPLEQIKDLITKINRKRNNRVYFHTDATQAILYQNCDVDKLGVDLLSFSGHKIYAPKGIGVLYVREGVAIERQVDGGFQESGFRAGTENIPYIVGLGEAAKNIKNINVESKRLIKLRDILIKEVLKIKDTALTGHALYRSPHIASFIIRKVEGESIVLRLSNKGVYISSGSACASSDLSPSHVLSAMGFSPEDSHGSIRISLGKETKMKDVQYLLSILPGVIGKLREMSPLI